MIDDSAILLAKEPPFLISSLLPVDAPRLTDDQCRLWRGTHCHSHRKREAMLVLDGTGSQSLNGAVYQTVPGTMLLFDQFERHDNAYSPDWSKGRHLWLSFYDDFANCIFDECNPPGVFCLRGRFVFTLKDLVRQFNHVWDCRRQIPGEVAVAELTAIIRVICSELVWNRAKMHNDMAHPDIQKKW